MERFLSETSVSMISYKARDLLIKYYNTHSIDVKLEIGELLRTLQDHGASPKELPIMDEMQRVILKR